MTRHDDTVALRHMRDHVAEAIDLSKGRSRVDLDRDRVLALALIKLVEIIGEAASRVSSDTQSKIAGVPWPQIIATRHRLVHGYDAVDLDILWRIISDELPTLVQRLDAAVSSNGTIPPR